MTVHTDPRPLRDDELLITRTFNAPVALVFDYASAWAWSTQPQGRDFDYFRLVFQFYRGLRRLGLSVDILPPETGDLSAYRLVLAPGLATIPPPLRALLPALGKMGFNTHENRPE